MSKMALRHYHRASVEANSALHDTRIQFVYQPTHTALVFSFVPQDELFTPVDLEIETTVLGLWCAAHEQLPHPEFQVLGNIGLLKPFQEWLGLNTKLPFTRCLDALPWRTSMTTWIKRQTLQKATGSKTAKKIQELRQKLTELEVFLADE